MGRAKVEMKRIENNTNRRVTYSKRRDGLMKKAYELSILCDIDLALIMFSPSGRLAHFSGKTRIEDVLARYINLSDQERKNDIQNKEYVLRILQQLRSENGIGHQLATAVDSDNIEQLRQEIDRLKQLLQVGEDQIRMYEPDPLKLSSLPEIESCERNLVETLASVMQRKQGMVNSFQNEVVAWLSNDSCSHSQIFDSSPPLKPITFSLVNDQFSQVGGINTLNLNLHNTGGETRVTNPDDSVDLQAAWAPSLPYNLTGHHHSSAPCMEPTLFDSIDQLDLWGWACYR